MELNLDPELVAELMAASGQETVDEAVAEAIREYIALLRYSAVAGRFGAVDYVRSYDYRTQRRR